MAAKIIFVLLGWWEGMGAEDTYIRGTNFYPFENFYFQDKLSYITVLSCPLIIKLITLFFTSELLLEV